jgi:hypothetical protein
VGPFAAAAAAAAAAGAAGLVLAVDLTFKNARVGAGGSLVGATAYGSAIVGPLDSLSELGGGGFDNAEVVAGRGGT